MAQHMTIEEIRDYLDKWTPPDQVIRIVDSITDIRSMSYDEGWDDALADSLADAQEPIPE